MTHCEYCGANVDNKEGICPRCGIYLTEVEERPPKGPIPLGVVLISLLDGMMSVTGLIFGAYFRSALLLLVAAATLAFSILLFYGYSFTRYLLIFFTFLLLLISIGLVDLISILVSIVLILYLTRPSVREYFSGKAMERSVNSNYKS